jgi:phenylalanyl-tRNA synthetase alpha chain
MQRRPQEQKRVGFTPNQKQRLRETGGDDYLDLTFEDEVTREEGFNHIAVALEKRNKQDLLRLLNVTRRPATRQVEREISDALIRAGFTEVTTPSIISRDFVNRMGITESHKLWNSIFWLDPTRCLRPMLAPNLYQVMRNLRRTARPVSIFEVGSCFRRESRGRQHAEEFAMLNAVELAPEKDPEKRLHEMIEIVLTAAQMPNYRLESTSSEVYGQTTDVIVDEVEVASAAVGPHPLDGNWSIVEPWVGVGFGIERIVMMKRSCRSIKHVSRSTGYLDGICLSIQ